jgi:hypothetical protein
MPEARIFSACYNFYSIMHPDLERLIELEKTDVEIRRLQAEVAALPHRVAAIEKKLAGTIAELDKAKAAIKETEGARRKYEGEIQSQQQKISKYRDQTFAVKTNEEYRALLNEINHAEREISGFEDKILESMIEVENREKDLKAAEKELAAERAEIEKEKAEAKRFTEQDEKALTQLLPRREELRKAIDPDHLRHYDRVVKLRGSAVAEAVNGECMACRVMLRPQVNNDVRGGNMILICDSCHRFLWHNPTRDVPKEAAQPEKTAKSEQVSAEAHPDVS